MAKPFSPDVDALFLHTISAHSTLQDATAPTITHSIDGHDNLDYSSAGADLAAVIEAEDAAQPISLDDEDWSHTALPADMPTQGTPANASDNHDVPFWYPAIAFQHAVSSRGDGLGAAFATYTVAHIETIADAKHAAFASQWHLMPSGAPKTWPTVWAFACAFKEFATAGRTSDTAAPFEASDEDGVDLDNKNASPNAYAILRRSPPKTASYAQYSAQHERESARLERVSQVRFPRTGTLARCLGPKA
jgi:hypothetical protein